MAAEQRRLNSVGVGINVTRACVGAVDTFARPCQSVLSLSCIEQSPGRDMKLKIFASDEGFGPLIRQSAIIEELRRRVPDLDATIRTKQHAGAARWILEGTRIVERHNNIRWPRDDKGVPDIAGIREYFSDYEERSFEFIVTEKQELAAKAVISDFVPEAFYVAHKLGIPAFGVSHFTWDWFFSKLYPLPLHTNIILRMQRYAHLAQRLYFPPFTPREILEFYKGKAKEVPLIVRPQSQALPNLDAAKNGFRVLTADSGSGVLQNYIRRCRTQLRDMADIDFFVSEQYGPEEENIHLIQKKQLFVDYMPHMDLVIGRAGFNTISECIAYRTPMLLIAEAINPEMRENFVQVKEWGLGSFVGIDQFADGFARFLPRFIDGEYRHLKENMQNHTIPSNGAAVIAADILACVNGG